MMKTQPHVKISHPIATPSPSTHERPTPPRDGKQSFLYPDAARVTRCGSISEVLNMDCTIGKGGYGAVNRCMTKSGGKEMAVKVIDEKTLTAHKRKLQNEVVVLASFPSHPHLLNLDQVVRVPGKCLCLVTELAPGGDLLDYIVGCPNYRMNETVALEVMRQLLMGVKALHDAEIVHRDIKPENVLIVKNDASGMQVKLCDFGFAARCTPTSELVSPCGTAAYSPPEVLFGMPYNNKVDIWSLGCTLYVMLHGKLPFPGKDVNHIKELMLGGAKNLRFGKHISYNAKSLISEMLNTNPKLRPDCDLLLDKMCLGGKGLYDPNRQPPQVTSKRFSLKFWKKQSSN